MLRLRSKLPPEIINASGITQIYAHSRQHNHIHIHSQLVIYLPSPPPIHKYRFLKERNDMVLYTIKLCSDDYNLPIPTPSLFPADTSKSYLFPKSDGGDASASRSSMIFNNIGGAFSSVALIVILYIYIHTSSG